VSLSEKYASEVFLAGGITSARGGHAACIYLPHDAGFTSMEGESMSDITDKAKGKANEWKGKAEREYGKQADDEDMEARGDRDEFKGKAQQFKGKAEDKLEDLKDKATD
jgi:uncharacterized protein YjbJ (UPF0337 family)